MVAAGLEFKRRQDGKWNHMTVEELAGKTLRECFEAWHGEEVVVKVADGFLCGTQSWLDYYAARGFKVMSFPAALETLAEKGQGASLDLEICPLSDDLLSTHMGGRVKSFKSISDD
jgi:hypothetical protein